MCVCVQKCTENEHVHSVTQHTQNSSKQNFQYIVLLFSVVVDCHSLVVSRTKLLHQQVILKILHKILIFSNDFVISFRIILLP